VAYGTLPKARRSELHERLARWLEGRSVSSDELVGFHLEQAYRYLVELGAEPGRTRQLAGEAGAKLGAAGLRAWRRADVAATVNLLGRAAELLPRRDSSRLELLCELGLALRTAGDIARANAVLEEATEGATVDGERRIELRARIELANSRLSSHPEGGADELLELVTNAIPLFDALGDDRSLGRAWLLSGYVQGGLRCHNVEWRKAAERALAHYEQSGWPTAACFGEIATALYYGPTPVPEAIRSCEALLGNVSDRGGEAHLLVWLGGLHAFRGRFEEGRELVDRASRIYDELGYRMAIAYGCGAVLGELEVLAGDPEAAERSLRASCEQLEEMRDQAFLASRAAELAETIYLQARYDEAERWTHVADAHAASDDVGAQFLLRAVRAKILARRELRTEAEAVGREAVDLAERTDALNQRAKALLDLAEVLRLGAKPDQATASIEAALDCLQRKGNLVAAERTRMLLDESRFSATPGQ
jgi:tetratricopeptide (TPR) repeat protein